jgi:hypothetical protein
VFRRSMLLVPALVAGLALPVAPAFAGEDDDDPATLHQKRDCVSDSRAKATVTGDDIDTVAFYVDGDRVKTVTRPTARGSYVFAMRCARLRVGTHRARAVVTFEDSSSSTLRFRITRSQQGFPRFTG